MKNGETAGTVKIMDNFYFATVYKAGHLVPMDAPESA